MGYLSKEEYKKRTLIKLDSALDNAMTLHKLVDISKENDITRVGKNYIRKAIKKFKEL